MWGFGRKDKQSINAQPSYERDGVSEPPLFLEPESALIARGGPHPDVQSAQREREESQAVTYALLDRLRVARSAQPAPVQPTAEPWQEAQVDGLRLPEPAPPARPAPVAEPPARAPEAPRPLERPVELKPVPEPSPEIVEPRGLFSRLREGLSRTGKGLTDGLSTMLLGKKAIDDELLEELETRLLLADVGVEATQRIIAGVTAAVARNQLKDEAALVKTLHENMVAILEPCSRPLVVDEAKQPFVLLVVGVNGAGKTTTIGKLARRFQGEGRSVILAAGDTFRAAAVEQLKVWGERSSIPVVAQHTGADSASVIFDALQAAKARGQQVMIADTAGRLHTQGNLMEELKKVKRVLGKLDGEAPHETLLVLDASNGQNALSQAKHFHEAIGVDGVVLTKLDGTAKGGVIFAIAEQLKLPIRFIGIGEKLEDLRVFDANEFVRALLSEE
jgi:fused signal recognition particle receptor